MMTWTAYLPDAVAGFIFVTALLMLTGSDWRWAMLNLALTYAGAAVLIARTWPWPLAATTLVGGWMAASVLSISKRTTETAPPPERPSAPLMRFAAGLLAALLAIAALQPMMRWLPPLPPSQLWGSLTLMFLGLLQVGLRSTRPFWVISGLLTVWIGFDVLYAVLEQSVALAGLFAAIIVALALAGGYFVLQEGEEEETAQ